MKVLITIIILIVLLILAVLLIFFAKKKPVKKIRIILAVVFEIPIFIGLIVSIINIKNMTDNKLKRISSEWECAEFLVEDTDTYTQFLNMSIESNGNFSMYDAGAGSPAIEGIITRIGSNKFLMICTNFSEFCPPPGWEDMNMIEIIEYEIDKTGNELLFRYRDNDYKATLKFYEY